VRASIVEDGLEMLDPYFEIAMQSNTVPGMVIGICNSGELVYNRAFGKADLDTDTPMTEDHMARGASIIKMLTAAIGLKLEITGALSLDDPVAMYVPELHEHPDRVFSELTFRQLLQHSSGLIRNGPRPTWWWDAHTPYPDWEKVLRMIMESTYDHEHIERGKARYSNIGYEPVAEGYQRATGQTYAELLDQHITGPLGIRDSLYPDYTQAIADRLATGYTDAGAGERYQALAFRKMTNALAPSVGVCLTSEANCRIGAAFLEEDSTVFVRRGEMVPRQGFLGIDGPGWPPFYGMGLHAFRFDPPLYGHTGGFDGFRSALVMNPEEQLVVSVLMNSTDAIPTDLAAGIMDTFEFAHFYGPASPELKFLRGMYRNPMAGIRQVTPGIGSLFLSDPTTWNPLKDLKQYYHKEDGAFRSGDEHPDEPIHFQPEGSLSGFGGLEFLPIRAFAHYMRSSNAARYNGAYP
jgi:D-alanyl-D-alanine carboxypeptidase